MVLVEAVACLTVLELGALVFLNLGTGWLNCLTQVLGCFDGLGVVLRPFFPVKAPKTGLSLLRRPERSYRAGATTQCHSQGPEPPLA